MTRGMETQAGREAGCSKWTEASAWGPWLLMSTGWQGPKLHTDPGWRTGVDTVKSGPQPDNTFMLRTFRRRGALGEG